jgi:hypothetical protein
MIIDEYVQAEVERQHSTQFREFRHAMLYAGMTNPADIKGAKTLSIFVQSVAERVDPNVNQFRLIGDAMTGYHTTLRSSHVGFMNGGSACPTNEVPDRFQRLMELWDISMCGWPLDVDQWVKRLLDIHPWVDGNGRTASILRNWMLGTLDDPTPLPYWYGE